jgi:hypothetical protein
MTALGPATPLVGRLARTASRRWADRLTIEPPGWSTLDAELDRWAPGTARFWWRDDDAVADTPALTRLLGLRARLGVPLALAVIPAQAQPSLATAIAVADVSVLVHGWDHHNHAAKPGAPSEFGAERAAPSVQADLARALERLAGLFGPAMLPVLVPPFNRIAPRLIGAVRRTGFTHLSIDRDFSGMPILTRNVHADLIDWARGTAPAPVQPVRALVAALRLRRYGLVARERPVGILTHHLVHDEPIWALNQAIIARLAAHKAAKFAALSEIFSP